MIQVQELLMPLLDHPMILISYLGEPYFYFLFLPFLYWCVSPALSLRLSLILLISSYSSYLLKWGFHMPRPYWIETGLKGMYAESQFSMPSAHAQNSITFWGYLAYLFQKYKGIRAFWIPAVFLIAAISFSRVYLGVHFPRDTIVGLGVGFLELMLFIYFLPTVIRWNNSGPPASQMFLYLVSGMLLVAIGYTVRNASFIEIPALWETNAALSHPPKPGTTAIFPWKVNLLITICASLTGMGLGNIFRKTYANFNPEGPWLKRLSRFLVGIVILAIIFILPRLGLPKEPELLYQGFRYLHYGTLAFLSVGGMPWVFLKLKLAEEV